MRECLYAYSYRACSSRSGYKAKGIYITKASYQQAALKKARPSAKSLPYAAAPPCAIQLNHSARSSDRSCSLGCWRIGWLRAVYAPFAPSYILYYSQSSHSQRCASLYRPPIAFAFAFVMDLMPALASVALLWLCGGPVQRIASFLLCVCGKRRKDRQGAGGSKKRKKKALRRRHPWEKGNHVQCQHTILGTLIFFSDKKTRIEDKNTGSRKDKYKYILPRRGLLYSIYGGIVGELQ